MISLKSGASRFDTPDPADPRLDVRATWRSAMNDTLFIYVSGTISHPKVQFDRPPDQALALLRGRRYALPEDMVDLVPQQLAGWQAKR